MLPLAVADEVEVVSVADSTSVHSLVTTGPAPGPFSAASWYCYGVQYVVTTELSTRGWMGMRNVVLVVSLAVSHFASVRSEVVALSDASVVEGVAVFEFGPPKSWKQES